MKQSAILLLLALLAPLMLRAGDKKDVAVGNNHVLVLRQDGSLWAFGRNSHGQIGDGTYQRCGNPVKIMDDVVQISAQDDKSMAVKSDGSLWAWGANDYGTLGDGSNEARFSPVKVMDNVRMACVGTRQSFAVDRNGVLWGWGENEDSQLGDGTTTDRLTPVKIMTGVKEVSGGDGAALILCEDGSLYETGIYFKPSAPRKIMDGVRKVSCLGSNMVLRNDGTLWMWGSNIHGQLGDGTTNSIYSAKEAMQVMSGVKDISNGRQHSMAICEDCSLWAWGGNRYSQLGDGTTTDRLRPVRIEGNVRSVSCGFTVSAWITADGELRMVGKPL